MLAGQARKLGSGLLNRLDGCLEAGHTVGDRGRFLRHGKLILQPLECVAACLQVLLGAAAFASHGLLKQVQRRLGVPAGSGPGQPDEHLQQAHHRSPACGLPEERVILAVAAQQRVAEGRPSRYDDLPVGAVGFAVGRGKGVLAPAAQEFQPQAVHHEGAHHRGEFGLAGEDGGLGLASDREAAGELFTRGVHAHRERL
ncbi:hypothetical protein [Streptomyces sp. NPDC051098]|uniref:hypothetical protein n=1 Tax=Streptomyces sp. NPDC051098 TaxID=3155411 RepID=UPI00343C500F